MTLAQHAEYRVDLALSLDPATGTVPPGPRPFGVRHPSNIVVAILWHQGENDAGQTDEASAHNGVAAWGACMELTIRRWRSRYGRDVPFIAGTFSTALPLWQPFVPRRGF